ncbi:MAG: hypothetical protein AAFZ80_10975 [Cyanobacteria bacterium P01_A01_bin.105]
MSRIALLSRNGSAPKRQGYLEQTVQAFFSDLSWEGVQAAPPAPATTPPLDSPAQLDQLASPKPGLEAVGTFFEQFPWDGQPAIGAPVEEPGISLDAVIPDVGSEGLDDLTLDAFSDLF